MQRRRPVGARRIDVDFLFDERSDGRDVAFHRRVGKAGVLPSARRCRAHPEDQRETGKGCSVGQPHHHNILPPDGENGRVRL